MSAPHFPPPRPKGGAYRAPAETPLAPAEAPAAPSPVVVHRPDAPPDSAASRRASAARTLVEGSSRERTFWARHRFFARHPRLVGGFSAAAGGFLTASNVGTLLNGGYYSPRGTVLGALALVVGLYALVFGYPLDDDGRVPRWYAFGLAGAVGAGALLGGLLVLALAS